MAWQIASANKTATGPATGEVERLVLLLGVTSVKASKRFYQEQGLTATKNFPGYVEFDSGAIKLALYKRLALAKQVGIDQPALERTTSPSSPTGHSPTPTNTPGSPRTTPSQPGS